ncbi:copper chaperone PCu(A)C [Streptomyces sp. H27-D2]|nr:copper chaperone PCu(A)C [Streptomyces sp. H27-D2]MEC4015816.1 copper chaperone PCu(A)C [Streptomyces sp. H27-D2]
MLPALLALVVGAALAGCSSEPSEPELKAAGAYMPVPMTGDMAGGFLTVRNSGDTADRLTSITSDLSDDVQLHKTVGNTMKQVKSLKIPANGELALSRGGNHVMFVKLRHKPKLGEKVAVELHFATSDPVKLELPVKAPNYNPEQ